MRLPPSPRGRSGKHAEADFDQRLSPMRLILVHGEGFDGPSKQGKPLPLVTNLPLSPDQTQAGPYRFWELAALSKSRWALASFF
ncbi:MAG TPA: hypothetical protein VFB38_04700 [Chthonomonadaceae bacterium]|nr:hypothetical protein [Chthonomonadaceae bacterium]